MSDPRHADAQRLAPAPDGYRWRRDDQRLRWELTRVDPPFAVAAVTDDEFAEVTRLVLDGWTANGT